MKVRKLIAELTSRELQILDFVITGCTSKYISSKLEISIKTVESHRTALMKKLQVDSVNRLIYFMLTGLNCAEIIRDSNEGLVPS